MKYLLDKLNLETRKQFNSNKVASKQNQNDSINQAPVSKNRSESHDIRFKSDLKKKIKSENKVSLFHPKTVNTNPKGKIVSNVTYLSSSNKKNEQRLNSNQFSIVISSPNNSKNMINTEIISHNSPCDREIMSNKSPQKAKFEATDNVNINYNYDESIKEGMFFCDDDKKYTTKMNLIKRDLLSNEKPSHECFIKNKYKLLIYNYNKQIIMYTFTY